MSSDITEVKKLLKDYEDKMEAASDLMSEAKVSSDKAQKLCDHAVTEKSESYCSGGYDYTDSTTTTCGICGLFISREVEDHGNYG